jgi:hypothetical protein
MKLSYTDALWSRPRHAGYLAIQSLQTRSNFSGDFIKEVFPIMENYFFITCKIHVLLSLQFAAARPREPDVLICIDTWGLNLPLYRGQGNLETKALFSNPQHQPRKSSPRHKDTTLPTHGQVLPGHLLIGISRWMISIAKLIVTIQATGETGYVRTISFRLCAPSALAPEDRMVQPQEATRTCATKIRGYFWRHEYGW